MSAIKDFYHEEILKGLGKITTETTEENGDN
jgi:hypothetical protein